MTTTLLTVLLLAFVALAISQPWHELQSSISGNVLLPGNSSYDAIRDQILRLPNDVPDDQPRAIVQPLSTADVSEIMKFAQDYSIPQVTALAGGHSSDGFSFPTDGIQIDFSLMTAITVNDSANYVDIQPGALSGNVTEALVPFGLGHQQGNCPTIGATGFLAYGGFGAWARVQGLGLDTIVEYELVKYNGDILTVNKDSYQELFFGLRGALPAYGIATRIRINVFDTSEFYGGHIFYQSNQTMAETILREWYTRVINTPDLFEDPNFMTRINVQSDRTEKLIRLNLEIIFWGSDSVGTKIDRLMPIINTTNADSIDFFPEFFEPGEPPLIPQNYSDYHLYNFASQIRTFTFVNNVQGYFRHGMLSTERIQMSGVLDDVVDAFMAGWNLSNPLSMGQLGELAIAGGKIEQVDADATAFHSRDFGFMWGYWTSYSSDDDFDDGRALYDGVATELTRISQNRGYYGNLNTIRFGREYDALGTNLPRLEALKLQHDPNNFFTRSWNISPGVGASCVTSCDNALVIINHFYFSLYMEFEEEIDFGDLITDGYVSVALYNPNLGEVARFDFESWTNNWTPTYDGSDIEQWRYQDGFNKVTLKELNTDNPTLKVRVFEPTFDVPNLPAELPLYVRIETGTEVCLQTTYNSALNTHAALIAYQTCP